MDVVDPAEASPEAASRLREEFRGFSWGSAVHGALAAAATGTEGAALRAMCRDLLVQNDRPLDDHGEPSELAELLKLVEAVQASDLWARAQKADRMLSEVPFALPGPDEIREEGAAQPPGTRTRPQLDLFGTPGPVASDGDRGEQDDGALRVLEGVIDLAFLETDGWVIADYKTDVGTDPDFQRRRAGYRRQVELYADAWARLTGDTVKERILFFTAQGRMERW